MKLAVRLILLLVVVAVGLWLWSVFFPGPERAIRQHLEKTARAASFKANVGPFDQLGKIGKFAQCFSPDVEVKFESPGVGSHSFSGRDDLKRAAGGARTQASALEVDFLDASVVVAPDHQTATVDLTVRATIPGDRDFFIQEMKLYLKKFGRSWLIIRVETVKTLSRVRSQSERPAGFCNLKGIVPHSLGLRGTSYPGWLPTRISTPTGLCHDSPAEPESRWDSSSSLA